MEIEEKRKLELFQLMDCFCGTLWWVKDTLWKQNPYFVPQTDRDKHPGVSILMHQGNQYITEVPMLLGTSNKHKNLVVVKDVSDTKSHKEKKKETYFGSLLKPCRFNFQNFFSGDIARNEHKKELNNNEMDKLHKFLRERLK